MVRITFSNWLSILFIGFLFLVIPANNILIAIFGLYSVVTQRKNLSWNILKDDQLLVMLAIPFLVFGLSILLSDNMLEGWKMFEKKLCLFLFPFFIRLYHPTEVEKSKTLIRLLSIFVATCALCLVYQTYLYCIGVGDSGLFYNDLLIGLVNMQAVYFSWFVTVFMVVTAWLGLKKQLTPIKTGIIMIFLLIVNILLASRIALFLGFIVFAFFLIYQLRDSLDSKKGTIVAISTTVLLITSIFFFPQTSNRIKSIGNTEVNFSNTNPINHFNGEIKDENWNGLNARLAIWTCTLDAIKNNPVVGYGIGDTEKALRKAYEVKGFTFGLRNNFNTHNQYLDILLNAGIIGLLLIVGAWCKVLHLAKINNNQLLFVFLLISMLVMLTENILNRNQGVFFFSFFISLFSLFNFNKKGQETI